MAFIVIVGISLVAKIGPSPVHLREDGERPPGHRNCEVQNIPKFGTRIGNLA